MLSPFKGVDTVSEKCVCVGGFLKHLPAAVEWQSAEEESAPLLEGSGELGLCSVGEQLRVNRQYPCCDNSAVQLVMTTQPPLPSSAASPHLLCTDQVLPLSSPSQSHQWRQPDVLL